MTGTHAPGTAANVNFASFPIENATFHAVPPSISGAGKVNFYATLFGPGVLAGQNEFGLWSGTPGNAGLVARTGNPSGLGAGINYASFTLLAFPSNSALNPVPINESGTIAYDAYVNGGGVDTLHDEGIWSGPATSPTLAVREGSPAAGYSPPTVYSGGGIGPTFAAPFLNSAGHLAFIGPTSAGQMTIWGGTPGSLQIIAAAGQHAPGTPAGVTFTPTTNLGPQSIVFNPSAFSGSDQIAFTTALIGPGVTPFNDGGIWAGTAGNVNLVARIGDQPPGMPAGYQFQTQVFGTNPFSSVEVNTAGQVAFASAVNDQPMGHFGSGIWAGTPGNLSLVIAGGAQAPGLAPGVTFTSDAFAITQFSAFRGVLENEQGHVSFAAALTGPGISGNDNAGIWAGLPGELHLVAQSGQQAPGAPPGQTLTFLPPPSTYYPTLGMNAAGQVAFMGQFSNSGSGIWGTDTIGQLREVIRTGESIQYAPGQSATVTSVSFLGGSGNADGRPSGLSDNGQVAFFAQLSDGHSGIFVSDALTVPEPGTLMLGGVAVLLLAARQIRRVRSCVQSAN